MTKQEQKQQLKNEALNKIRRIYNPHYKYPYSFNFSEDGSYAEQRDQDIRQIIEDLEKELRALTNKK